MNIAADRRQFTADAGEIGIAGERAVCDPRGAFFLPACGLLVVSDLHLEKGSSFARRGRLLPPYDSAATLALLGAVVADWRPRTVVSLGDSFHDRRGAELLPATYRDRLLALPTFLHAGGSPGPDGVAQGFTLTGYFLDRHVWGPRGLAAPEERARFVALGREAE